MTEANAQASLSAGENQKGERAMSILDMIMGAAERHPEVSDEQHTSLIQSAMQMFGNRAGVSGLLQNAQSRGLGGTVQSWIGSGANQEIDAMQVHSLVGQERVEQMASRAGVSPMIASAALSRILPVLVDKFTPQGKLPQAA